MLFDDLLREKPEVIRYYARVNRNYSRLLKYIARRFSVPCIECGGKPGLVTTTTAEMMRRPKVRYRVCIGCCGSLYEDESFYGYFIATIRAIIKWNDIEDNQRKWLNKYKIRRN